MWQYDNSYLMHYGVLGMKWGVRRARKNREKAVTSSNSAKKWDEKARHAKSRGESKAVAKYRRNAAENRANIKKYQNKANAIERKYKNRAGSDTYNRVKNMSTAKAVGQSLVFGSYGALKYNQARSAGSGRLLSAGQAILSNYLIL